MDILIIAILTLATFGLTDLITKQDGLFNIFKRWRNFLARQRPEIDEACEDDDAWAMYDRLFNAWERSPSAHLYELFSCPYCLGFWIAGVAVVVYTGIGWYTLVYWLSVYGLHSIICRKVY